MSKQINNIESICDECVDKIRKFWQKTYGEVKLDGSLIKFTLSGSKMKEHIWATVNEDLGNKLVVTLDNDPVNPGYEYKQRLTIMRTDIIGHISKDHSFEKYMSERAAVTNQHHHN